MAINKYETPEEAHIRRTREPVLKWEYITAAKSAIRARNNRYYYYIRERRPNEYIVKGGPRYGPTGLLKIGKFKDIDEAKHEVLEHWREHGYE